MYSQGNTPHILCVVGARPNFMKIAPILRAIGHPSSGLSASLVHTGQHYDAAMKHAFFDQLAIPEPDEDLGVGSGSHAQQTAQIMQRFEPVLEARNPTAVLVVGDVNSTIACALVAAKRHVPVIHVEAGLRSGDRRMPEEINRVLTDQLSELLFTTEEGARANLLAEGIDDARIFHVGNVMVDTLFYCLPRAVAAADTLALGTGPAIAAGEHGVLTLHRPSNVDDPTTLARLIDALTVVAEQTPLAFPVHPRTQARLAASGLEERLRKANVRLLPPIGYLEMLGLMRSARVVLTDSGGMQEETTALGVPCITLRENTERPVTVSEGSNTVVGTNVEAILEAHRAARGMDAKACRRPALWDGRAAERIVEEIARCYGVAEAA